MSLAAEFNDGVQAYSPGTTVRICYSAAGSSGRGLCVDPRRTGFAVGSSSCKTDNPADAAFCEQCGSKLSWFVLHALAAVSPRARFCKKSGIAIAVSGPVSVKKFTDGPIRIGDVTAPETIEGERKTVAALFADIKGSMELIEDLDPEEARHC